MSPGEARVRLDKWLWAARFFKTRNLAKQAIEGGKVWYDGARAKVSKDVQLGATLRIRQGVDEKTVCVTALSDQRRGAPEATLLYSETADSVAAREQLAQRRKLHHHDGFADAGRPSKRDRRQIHKFREQHQDS